MNAIGLRRQTPYAIALVLVAAAAMVPWAPEVPTATLDDGWRVGLLTAHEQGFAFGRDTVFTFGPLGFLVSGLYSGSTYVPTLLFWACLASLTGLLAARRLPDDVRFGEVVASAAGLLCFGLSIDVALVALPTLLVLHAASGRENPWLSRLAVAATGPLALAKITLVPIGLLSVGITSLMAKERQGRALLLNGAIGAGGFLLSWLAAGQPLQAIPDYLRYSAEITAGYPAAMSAPTLAVLESNPLSLFSLAVVLTALVVLGVIVWTACALRTLAVALTVTFVAGMLWIVVHQGVIRNDIFHLTTPSLFAAGIALLWLRAPGRLSEVLRLTALASFLLSLQLFGTLTTRYFYPTDYLRLRASRTADVVRGLLRGQSPRTVLDAMGSSGIQELASAWRPFAESVTSYDLIGAEQHLLRVLPKDKWRPHLVLQGYASYTEALARADARSWCAATAPDWVVASANVIDRRWPMSDNSLTWPALKRLYEAAGRREGLVLVRKRSAPSQALVAGDVTEIASTGWTELPAMSGDWYARITWNRSWSSTIKGLLWKPPAYLLEVRLDGEAGERRFRLVQAIAESTGFLISPVVLDNSDLALWFEGRESEMHRIKSFRVVDDAGAPVAARMQIAGSPFSGTEIVNCSSHD